uniref:Uncharacterized protein n=1 Tax=Romanomermis culicivorax TaxID=13658 RepID=A0A915KQJ1_ROMCU
MSAILWRYSSIPPIRHCLETQSIAARFPPNFDSILNFVSQIRGVSFDDAKVEIDQYANIVEQLENFSIDNSQETLDNLENLLKELRNRYATAKCIKIFLKTD